MKRIFLILLIFLASLQSKELEKVSLQLHWKYQFEFAGFIAAKEKGFYRDIGLDVDLKPYNFGMDLEDEVLSGRSNYGIYNSNILISSLKNKPIKLLSSFFKRSALVIITKPEIKTPKDLIGKKVMAATKKDFDFNFKYIFDSENIDTNSLKFIPHSYTIDEFANGEVDAMTAFISDQPYKLDMKNVKYNIIDPSDYGIYNLQLELFTSKKESIRYPNRTQDFIDATVKGWEYALANEDEIIDIIISKYDKTLSKKALQYEAKITSRLILPRMYQIGSFDKNFLIKQIELFKNDYSLEGDLSLDEFLFNSINQKKLNFSYQELKYIENKKSIKVCMIPKQYPFVIPDKDTFIGMSIEFLKEFTEKLNLEFKHLETKTLEEYLGMLKNGKCDILPILATKPNTYKFLTTTKPYVFDNLVIITKINEPYVNDLNTITNKKIAIQKGANNLIAYVKSIYPNMNLIEVNDIGIERVANGEFYAQIGTSYQLSYQIATEYFGELKIMSKIGNNKIGGSFGITNREPILLGIFNKLIDNMPNLEKQHIYNVWSNIKVQKQFNYTIVWQLTLVFILILSIVVYFLIKQNRLRANIESLNHTLESRISKATLELKNQNNQLQEASNNFQNLINIAMEAIMIFDENKNLKDINQPGIKMFNYSTKEETIGMNIMTFIPDYELSKVQKYLAKEILTPFEINLYRRDKTLFSAFVSGRNTIIDGKQMKITTVIDLTQIKEKEQQFFQQSRLAQMGEMMSMIAHQWRQPLAAISALGASLELKADLNKLDNDIVAEHAKNISKFSQHLSSTIDDFRDFFKPTKSKKVISLDEAIDSALNIIGTSIENKNISIVKKLNSKERFETYSNELKQVILNLLKNAEDILLEKEISDPVITIVTESNSLSIKDNAGGVSEDVINKIFDPYFSTKMEKNGTGLGLYMSKTIIEEHCGGRLSVLNDEDGAVFTVKF